MSEITNNTTVCSATCSDQYQQQQQKHIKALHYWAVSYYSELMLSQEFQTMTAQLSMKAALPLAKILATVSCRSRKTGPWSYGRETTCHWLIPLTRASNADGDSMPSRHPDPKTPINHYDDVIMSAIASQIPSLPIVYSIIYSDADQRKHQSSASLAFVWGIHRWPVNSPHKWPVTRKMFPFDDVIMFNCDFANVELIVVRLSKSLTTLILGSSEITTVADFMALALLRPLKS